MSTSTTNITLRPSAAIPLAYEMIAGEAREVLASIQPNGSLCVYERTEGELTACLYGAPWHEQLVTLSSAQVPIALGIMNEAGHVQLLRDFFVSGEQHLSDFMDALDSALIPYRYEALVPGEPPLRRDENVRP